MIERKDQEEQERQNMLAIQKAKEAAIQADIKQRIRIEEEERGKVRELVCNGKGI